MVNLSPSIAKNRVNSSPLSAGFDITSALTLIWFPVTSQRPEKAIIRLKIAARSASLVGPAKVGGTAIMVQRPLASNVLIPSMSFVHHLAVVGHGELQRDQPPGADQSGKACFFQFCPSIWTLIAAYHVWAAW